MYLNLFLISVIDVHATSMSLLIYTFIMHIFKVMLRLTMVLNSKTSLKLSFS